MEGKTDNELVAEFMDESFHRDKNWHHEHWKDMPFNSSWDWLMPVVEKIRKVLEEMHKSMPPNSANKGDMIDVDLSCGFMGVPDIEVIYKHSVEFIKWYNRQKEK